MRGCENVCTVPRVARESLLLEGVTDMHADEHVDVCVWRFSKVESLRGSHKGVFETFLWEWELHV